MQGYDPQVNAADLVRRHGPEVAQQIIAEFMRDRGMSPRNADLWAGMDVRSAQRWASAPGISDGMDGAPEFEVGNDAPLGEAKPAKKPFGGSGEPTAPPAYETVPGPRGVGGIPVRPPQPMNDAEEIAGYQERQFDTTTGKYTPSQKDRDMMERGMVPVLNADGTVGYSIGYDVDPLARGIPGGPGRAGQRKDLENAGWGATTVDGPMGPVTVYRPGPDAKKRYQAQEDDRTRVRLAKRAGIGGSAAMGMSVDELRTRAKAAGVDDYNARNATWKAQAMLAGGQPTGGPRGTKALTNALLMIEDPEARQRSLQYMLPGGALSAQVDARNLESAAALAQRAVTGALAGTAQGPMAQAQAELAQLQAQQQRDQMRQADEDVLGQKYAPSGWLGYDEFTVAEQQQMYDDLIAQGYKPAEAQRAVDRQAEKRRATDRHRWNSTGA